MAPKRNHEWDEQGTVIPLLLVLVGVVVLMVNLGFASVEWIAYWPVLLIVIGLWKFIDRN